MGRRATPRTVRKNPAPVRPWPADKVERRPIGTLIPYAKNARTHSEAQVAQIAASITEWGWTMPVLVDETSNIIAGHGRVLAAQQLGLEEIPVMVATGWTPAQRQAYVIADNKLAENARWDDALLAAEIGDLQTTDFNIGLTGFTEIEIGELLADRNDGRTDPDAVTEVPAEPVSVLGDIWRLGRHRLACGDSTSPELVTKLLAGAKPRLMVTDPPYGVEYDPNWRNERARTSAGMGNRALGAGAVGKVSNDDRADWREAWALFPGDVAYVWCASLFSPVVAVSLQKAGFALRAQIIWDKERLIIGRGDYHWQHEPCWYAVRKGKTGHWCGGRKQTTVWGIPHQVSETGHGTQKPIECMKRPIENNSKAGQSIYEPFSGSGTTIIAAEMTGRACYAIELSPAYVDVAVRRWQEFTGEKAVLEGTRRAFVQIASDRRAPKPTPKPVGQASANEGQEASAAE